MKQANVGFLLQKSEGPLSHGQFTATTCQLNAVPQTLLPSAVSTSLTANTGILVANEWISLSRALFRFTWNAANVGGQTVEFALYMNGVAIPGATSGALATNLGVPQTVIIDYPPVTPAEGDSITCILTPSSVLTAACTNLYAVLS